MLSTRGLELPLASSLKMCCISCLLATVLMTLFSFFFSAILVVLWGEFLAFAPWSATVRRSRSCDRYAPMPVSTLQSSPGRVHGGVRASFDVDEACSYLVSPRRYTRGPGQWTCPCGAAGR